MDIRVKGICVTGDGNLVVIRRQRGTADPYWVFPGGGVEPQDRSPLAALHRELDEEIAADVSAGPVVHVIERELDGGERQEEWFYMCRLHRWSPDGGGGPEWSRVDPENTYAVQELSWEQIGSLNLLPATVAELLAAQRAEQLFAAPTLR